MRAIQQTEFGGPEVLELVDLPEPEAGPGRLRIRVTHAGLNTVLDCAAAQVPMVAIPLAFEQPATEIADCRVLQTWVEGRLGQQQLLLDPDDLPGRYDSGIEDDADLQALQDAFEDERTADECEGRADEVTRNRAVIEAYLGKKWMDLAAD